MSLKYPGASKDENTFGQGLQFLSNCCLSLPWPWTPVISTMAYSRPLLRRNPNCGNEWTQGRKRLLWAGNQVKGDVRERPGGQISPRISIVLLWGLPNEEVKTPTGRAECIPSQRERQGRDIQRDLTSLRSPAHFTESDFPKVTKEVEYVSKEDHRDAQLLGGFDDMDYKGGPQPALPLSFPILSSSIKVHTAYEL